MTATENSNSEFQAYEIGYLVLPSIAEDKLSAVVDKIKAIVARAGGKELDGEAPFMLDLAYTMSKTVGASRYVANEAYLGGLKFDLEPSKALEVKAAVEKIDEILRLLLIKVPREATFSFAKAQALLAEKEAREKQDKADAELAEETPRAASEAVVE
jgi:ribosomal protein S6